MVTQSLTINVTQPRDAQKLAPENLVHQTEFNQVIRWINEAEESFNQSEEHYLHQTITILGTRGSGKTTFLLSLQKYFDTKEKEVLFFPIIDPTLIEDKGHIFLNVISAIDEKVMEEINSKIADGPWSTDIKREWEEHLNKLASGLPSIDGVGTHQMDQGWQDPKYIMEKGMQALLSARNLKNHFRELVQKALEILKKKYFIIAFDDIDINFQKGWPVLEMLRKYFAQTKIVTIVSGNLQLYTLSVRQHYKSNFEKDIFYNHKDINQDSSLESRMLTEMEGQYLLKVLKPERRVQLPTLFEIFEQWKLRKTSQNQAGSFNSPEFPVYIDYGAPNNTSVNSIYSRLCSDLGINNQYQMETYSSFLLGLPLRTQIQLLAEYTKKRYENDPLVRLEEPFLTELFEKRLDTNMLHKNPHLINVETLKFLLRENGLADLYQLQPVTGDQTINSCLVALSFLFTKKAVSEPYLIFDFFIKIGYVRNLQSVLGDNGLETVGRPSIQGLCKYAGIFQNKVLRDTVGNMTSYLKGVQPTASTWAGFISLPGLGTTARQSESSIADRIDIVLSNESGENKVLGFLPLSLGTYSTKNRTVPLYSLFMLLGSIGEIIRKAQQKDLTKGLIELSQVRTYTIPEFSDIGSFISNDNPSNLDDQMTELSGLSNLSDHIEKWITKYPAHVPIAPHLLGKIITRTFYALNSIESTSQPENLGDLMNIRVMAFCNAILIEEARENVFEFQSFNINNTVLSSKIFITNLKAANKVGKEAMLFSKWMLSCPLLRSFLEPENQVINMLANFCDTTVYELEESSIFPVLKKIEVKRSLAPTRSQKADTNNEELVNIYREHRVPFEWFTDDNIDRVTRRRYNENIRRKMGELVGISNWSSQKIRNFRKYLNEKHIRW